MREWRIGVNNSELWVAVQGAGPPIVLCTGGAGLCDYLGPVAAMVDDLVQVYRFDPRGCGRSSVSPPYGLQTLLADLEGLRAALGHQRWLVGGHSFGADIALAYALEYPDRVLAVVYVAGTGVQDDRQWHAAYEAGTAAGRDPIPPVDYPFNPDVNREANTSWRSYIKQPMLLRRIAELRMPLLAVSGSEDVRPDWPVQQLVQLMANARMETIRGAGHCPWLTHGAEFRSRLRAFLHEMAASDTSKTASDAPVLSDGTVALDAFHTESKADLHHYLQAARDAALWKLNGLSEYEVRRPMTPTGTNLLGLVKHLTSVELGYFGDTFGRPFDEPLLWTGSDMEPNLDMWATAEESREYIVELYKRACMHSDATIEALGLDEVGTVAWWPAEHSQVTLQLILVHVIAETHRHAGHADIVRELIDGAVGRQPGNDNMARGDHAWWKNYRNQLEQVAQTAGVESARP